MRWKEGVPRVLFLLPGGERREVEAPAGARVLDAAQRAGIGIEGACCGSLACATCHVIVAEEWFDRLEPPTPEEEDMLDFAQELAPTSRLGCQLRLSPELDGLTLRVPRSSLLD